MIIFRKAESVTRMPNGAWAPFRKVNRGMSAIVSCPKCGYQALLDHEIAVDGTIRSFSCPNHWCDFCSGGKLEGWSE